MNLTEFMALIAMLTYSCQYFSYLNCIYDWNYGFNVFHTH